MRSGSGPDGMKEGLSMTNQIEVFTQNSIRIRSDACTMYIDPFRIPEAPNDADYILITHDHYDHFSPEDIEKVSRKNTVLVVPEKMMKKARETQHLVGRIETVRPGEHTTVQGLELETVPAYNTLKPFHPKRSGWVGYILSLAGQRIYIAGDTDLTKENRQVRCDVALIPIGGTYTMDVKKAAELINEIKPNVAIPTHYGSIVGKPEDAAAFSSLVKPPVRVEVKIRT